VKWRNALGPRLDSISNVNLIFLMRSPTLTRDTNELDFLSLGKITDAGGEI
jgi:hypothetical protein